jgi:hypothetical protein
MIAHGPWSRAPSFLFQKACRLFGRWPGVECSTRALGESAAPLGFAPRFTVSETVVLLVALQSKKESGYRCCPGLGLFTKQVPMLLGQAGVNVGSPGVAPGLHRLRVGCTVCQYAEPVKRKIAPGGAAPPSPPYERGVLAVGPRSGTAHGGKNCSGENRTHYLLVMSQAACHLHLAAIKRSIRRTCTGLLSVTDGPQRYLCLDGMKLDTHPGLAPGKIGFADRRLVDLAMCVKENWSGAWDSHPPRRLHRPECCWLHYHLKDLADSVCRM